MKTQNYINHIAFVVDRSGSMSHLSNKVVQVFDAQIKHLSKRSQELDQETRASVYLFDTSTECLFYDKDVMRLPSLASLYQAGGGTALVDGAMQAINELKQTAQLHGDHAFLIYVLTDGEENSSSTRPSTLQKALADLPDNWTVAVLVPDAQGESEAKRFGFSKDNIMQWSTTEKGMEEVGEKLRTVTDSYMTGRTQGIRGTRSLFKVDTSNLASRKVSDTLDALPANKYYLLDVYRDSDIRSFVEASPVGQYVTGNTFYQLTKSEKIQSYKKVAVQNKVSGRVYVGDQARDLIGLPAFDAKVKPEDASKFNIFIQSTSVNRKLVKGTKALVLV